MTTMEVEKKIKVQANVNRDIGVAEYGGQYFAIIENELGMELAPSEIGERIINLARVKYGINLVNEDVFPSGNGGEEELQE